MTSNVNAVVAGIFGLLAGIVIGGFLVPGRLMGWHGWGVDIGSPYGVLQVVPRFVPLLFYLAFWALLIGGALWIMGLFRRSRPYRLEDLPADFDEWHRRAHAHMKEAATADDSGRRG